MTYYDTFNVFFSHICEKCSYKSIFDSIKVRKGEYNYFSPKENLRLKVTTVLDFNSDTRRKEEGKLKWGELG